MHEYELQICKSYDETFSALVSAAVKFGKILDENKLLGYVHFKSKFWSWTCNPAKFIVNIKMVDENNTDVKMQVQPTLGSSVSLNQEQSNKTYTEFIKVLSKEIK